MSEVEARADERPIPGDGLARLMPWLVLLAATRLSPEMIRGFASVWQQIYYSLRRDPWHLPAVSGMNAVAIDFGRLAWPVALAWAVRRRRSPNLAKAVTVTFAILAAETLVSVIFGSGFGLVFGSAAEGFDGERHTRGGRIAALVLGSARLVAELIAMYRAGRLAVEAHGQARRNGERRGSPRAVAGRLAVMGAFGFFVLVFSNPLWDGYVFLVSSDSGLRRMVLRGDTRPPRPRIYRESPYDRRVRRSDQAHQEGAMFDRLEQYSEAVSAYRRGVNLDAALYDDYPEVSETTGRLALSRNNLAWLLSTCPDPSARDPGAAIELARGAVKLAPDDGNNWNTLGVARFRAGDFEESERSLRRAMDLRGGGDSFDWYFLAMIHQRRGDGSEARRFYDEAVAWADKNRPLNSELYRFRVEAASALGLPEPPPLGERISPRGSAVGGGVRKPKRP